MEKEIKPEDILLLISDLEGAFHHLGRLGFCEDQDIVKALKPKYYKMYFKLCKELGRDPY